MSTSMIRWSKDDRQNLQKAVNNFNAKIRRLKRKGYTDLPKMVSYEEYRGWKNLQDNEFSQEIFTRNQLNKIMKSLKSFTKKGAEKKVTLSSGETLTSWEYNQIKSARKTARRLLNRNLEMQEWAKQFGMGTGEDEVTRKVLEGIENIENKKGYDFKRVKERLMSLSRYDREVQRAMVWRRNFENALDELDNYDNIDLLKEKMKTIKNPIKLYEYLKDNEELMDLFLYYKEKPSNRTYGGYDNNQEAIDNALQRLGLIE